ncbi:Threonine/homoserine exporter RhtA [Microbacterium ginsengisoli]|uniref:Threonine/homoserine exporter RhtA n=1 Tax=Microbacterium ginsengisoli TaxID=400772 RepID=A0A0F0LW75_9MICO|nr:EamA family transporter [Microbacterium ginsengisoli]KJL38265.1 Threonine/homoserine exporter RhtA [Microbacterium ginsengisoli]MBN9209629.1 EamA family transporter [Microbacterium ginsengisoli]
MPAILAVLAAAVLFGTTGTSQALGPAGTTPLGVGAMRLLVGGTVLAVAGFALAARARARRGIRNPPLSRRAVLLMVVTGVCLAGYQPLFFLGTSRNGVAIGTVVALGSAPVLAGLLEWMLRRRAPRPVWLVATVLALAGVAIITLGGEGTGAVDPLGVVGSVGAGAAFAMYANAQRRLMDDGWDPFTVAGAMGLTSALAALAMVPFASFAWLADPRGAAMALWLGVATIAVAYVLFTWGLERMSAATAATLTLAEPLTATLLGILVLGEHLTLGGVIGLCVLAAGLVLLSAGSRARREPRPFAAEA